MPTVLRGDNGEPHHFETQAAAFEYGCENINDSVYDWYAAPVRRRVVA